MKLEKVKIENFRGIQKEELSFIHWWLQREHDVLLMLKRLLSELEKATPVVYSRDRLVHGTDDFLDLANGVRKLAGLGPLS